jgi:uncharacterized membrane protein YccC
MTSLTSHRHSFDMLAGVLNRTNATLFSPNTEWAQVLRFILAALLALAVAYGVGLTGGLVTVIAVLFMPALPHSPTLGLMRAGAAVLGFGIGWILSYQFVDQPWFLIMLLMANAFFWFYMMASGLPFLTMMLLGLMPVLVVWMVYADLPPSVVATVLAEFLCGVFASEVVALTWSNSGEKRIRKRAAAAMRGFAVEIRTTYGEDRPDERTRGEADWNPSQSTNFNSLLLIARAELGEASPEYRRLCALVEHIRYLVAWPKIYESFVRGGHFDQWMIDLEKEREALHQAIYASMEALAVALETGRPADCQPDIERCFEAIDVRTSAWLDEHRASLPLQTIALIEARCQYGEYVVERIGSIVDFTRGEQVGEEEIARDLPSPTFSGMFLDYDAKKGLFAFKALLCVMVGFVIASLYPSWEGSLIVLLMSGFLAPLTVGGLNVMFIDRIWGLALAVIACGLVILVLMPNLVQIGGLLLVVGVVMLPGIVLAMIPRTGSMGLSYAMAVLFILTGSDHPSASLEPLQVRAISVGGATLVCYIVFRWVLPVIARDVLTVRLKALLDSVADLIYHCRMSDEDKSVIRIESRNRRHAAVRSGAELAQLFEDIGWESNPPESIVRMRRDMIGVLGANLILAAANSNLVENECMRLDPELSDAMDETLGRLGDTQVRLGELAESIGPGRTIFPQLAMVDAAIAAERAMIIDHGLLDHLGHEDPKRGEARVVLAEFSHHISMRRVQQKMFRYLQIRNALHAKIEPEAVGRTS